MKKVFFVLLSVLLLVCIPCAAGASDNIKIFVNGQQVFSDVPPQAIDGRTMVPIRVVSEALGAQVIWNDNTNSVEITNTTSEINNNEVNDRAKLKLYLKIASHYYKLAELYEQFADISRELDFAVYACFNYSYSSPHSKNRALQEFKAKAKDKYEKAAASVESIRQENQQLVDEAEKAGINIADTNEILLNYDNAIACYKKTLDTLFIYYYNEDNYYTKNFGLGYDESIAGAQKAHEGYVRFYNLIQGL